MEWVYNLLRFDKAIEKIIFKAVEARYWTRTRGPYRVTKRFLWLPLKLEGKTKWMVHARVGEVNVYSCELIFKENKLIRKYEWKPQCWLN